MLINLKLGYVFFTSLLSQDVGPIWSFSGSCTTESFTFQKMDARRTQFPWMALHEGFCVPQLSSEV